MLSPCFSLCHFVITSLTIVPSNRPFNATFFRCVASLSETCLVYLTPVYVVVHTCLLTARYVQMTLPDVYPVRVAGDSPVLLGLTLLDVPDRNPLLPPLYSYEGAHPYHRLRPRDGITYIYLVDPSPKGKAVAAAIANSMEVPAGPIAGAFIYLSKSPSYI